MNINSIQSGANIEVYGVNPKPAVNEKPYEKTDETAGSPRKKDEYIPSEKDEPIGLYKLSEDENGDPVIDFDMVDSGKNIKSEKSEEDDSEKKTESCTCNTDRVDEEIKRLKEKQEQLEQQLRAAEGEAAKQLQKQLESVSAELAMKDNDSYRRQQAIFS